MMIVLQMVQKIGDLLVEHWSGSSGEEMKKLFGAFCSRNNEMLHTYRELLKNDKKFASFVKVCDFIILFLNSFPFSSLVVCFELFMNLYFVRLVIFVIISKLYR